MFQQNGEQVYRPTNSPTQNQRQHAEPTHDHRLSHNAADLATAVFDQVMADIDPDLQFEAALQMAINTPIPESTSLSNDENFTEAYARRSD